MSDNSPPRAIVKTRVARIWKSSRMWWMTIVCGMVAIAVVVSAIGAGGPRIGIKFLDGHGIKPGDTLRYRGIDVGEVELVELSDDQQGVHIVVRMEEQADVLARDGSRFWIERPQVGLSRVSGLETVVGAKYIGVLPGPAGRSARSEFTGIETPPLIRESTGTEMSIRFSDGYDLKVGDPVKHRGIDIGEVTAVTLNDDYSGIEVHARLAASAKGIAVAGTRFWIERPRVAVAELRGLETLVGGRYLAVAPGNPESPPLYEFDGLDAAPAGVLETGGIEIILDSQQRDGLSRGAPVLYRGLQVGHVMAVGLAHDAATVEARVYIAPGYKSLVRDGTVFWRNSGVSFNISLSEGIELNTDTLSALAVGGVAMATPTDAKERASTGHRFPYFAKMPDDANNWQPRIAIGTAALRGGQVLPQPQRAVLRWTSKTFGFQRERENRGWILALSDGRLLGPADLLGRADGAVDDSATLEAGGTTWSVTSNLTPADIGTGTFRPTEPLPDDFVRWPIGSVRTPDSVEDMMLVADTMSAPVPLLANRITVHDEKWTVDPSLSMDHQWHGACAVAQSDGKLIGMLIIDDGKSRVVRIDHALNE